MAAHVTRRADLAQVTLVKQATATPLHGLTRDHHIESDVGVVSMLALEQALEARPCLAN